MSFLESSLGLHVDGHTPCSPVSLAVGHAWHEFSSLLCSQHREGTSWDSPDYCMKLLAAPGAGAPPCLLGPICMSYRPLLLRYLFPVPWGLRFWGFVCILSSCVGMWASSHLNFFCLVEHSFCPLWCLCQKLSLSPLSFNKTLLHKSSEQSSLVLGPGLNSSPP